MSFAYVQDGFRRSYADATKLSCNFKFSRQRNERVSVGYDSAPKGNSSDSLPGTPPHKFPQGDWMTRVAMDHKK